MRKKNRDVIARIGLAAMCLIVISRCVYYLARGQTGYQNYWGGVVFVPIAILVLLLLLLVLWKWDKWIKVRTDEKGRFIKCPAMIGKNGST